MPVTSATMIVSEVLKNMGTFQICECPQAVYPTSTGQAAGGSRAVCLAVQSGVACQGRLATNAIFASQDIWLHVFEISGEGSVELGLTGQTAVVTGASKGIGLAVARGLAAEGCAVHIVARNHAAIESAAQGIRKQYAVTAKAHALDLARSESVAALIDATGTPDILVNNAGAIPGGDLLTVDETRWRAAWDLKVFGYINLCRAYYAAMRSKRKGVIINVTGL